MCANKMNKRKKIQCEINSLIFPRAVFTSAATVKGRSRYMVMHIGDERLADFMLFFAVQTFIS